MLERARIIPMQKALSSGSKTWAVLNLDGCGHLGFADTIFTLVQPWFSLYLKLTFSGSLRQKQA